MKGDWANTVKRYVCNMKYQVTENICCLPNYEVVTCVRPPVATHAFWDSLFVALPGSVIFRCTKIKTVGMEVWPHRLDTHE